MRLRVILLIITLLALLSAATGGYLYYSRMSLQLANEAEKDATIQIAAVKSHLSSFLAEQLKPVRILAGLDEMRRALEQANEPNLGSANGILDLFTVTLNADVCYLLDETGTTIASSNRLEKDSFVGQNFSFRPYFQEAIRGIPSTYMALGSTSGKRGVYYGYPVLDSSKLRPIGIVVIKASILPIEEKFRRGHHANLLLIDPHGIIFAADDPKWPLHSLWQLSDDEKQTVAKSLQFGSGPWEWLGFTRIDSKTVIDEGQTVYLLHQQPLEEFSGWQIVYLAPAPSGLDVLHTPAARTTGAVILFLYLLVGFCVFFLYRKASREILQRKTAEHALKESEERYRTLYLHTPAMLHSIDPKGRMVSISDYWRESLGYSRSEVLGRRVTEFMTEESRRYAEEIVIPRFLRKGSCKDIPYQFIKKNGEIIDVLLSAFAERDKKGKIKRSLAILVDVTALKRAEAALKQKSEELRLYSQNLERQVKERTREITSILRYTPAIVYMKDRDGRYQLVNSRFEELFGVKASDVVGKTDADLFSPGTARQFEENDHKVLDGDESLQVEETVPLEDGSHTYLSVKFPLFDDHGQVSGVGGISTDITALKKAQAQLRRLSASILSSQEKERTAIARELHDELGQVLTALRMDAVWLDEKLRGTDSAVNSRTHTMCSLIDRTIDEVRGMAVRLRPGVLDDLGLLAALEWLVDDFEKRSEISCTFRHADVPEVNETVATVIYRITQEALTNVTRHSGANHAEVNLSRDNDSLLLTICDDGKGFDSGILEEGEGLGVTGMRERAGLVGASVEINSKPGEGTTVMLRVKVTK